MSEPASAASADARSAGAMLRAARERQGLHIAALSAAIKVPKTKLEALEAGRYEELTDATFVRALAHSVCRALKIDPKPVLELLPPVHSALLERVDQGLKAPFHNRPGPQEPTEERLWHQPVFWIVAVLLTAAAAFVLWPQRASLWASVSSMAALGGSFGGSSGSATPTPEASAPAAPATPPPAPPAAPDTAAATPAPTAPAATPDPTVASPPAASSTVSTETVHSAPGPAAGADADTPAGLAVVRATEPSWVEAQDARGNMLLSRTLQPGESVGLDGPLPLRLVIGNSTATEVTLRGKRITLGAPNRDNVVRLELK